VGGLGRWRAPACAALGRVRPTGRVLAVLVVAVAAVAPASAAEATRANVADPLRTIHVGGVPDRVVVGAGTVWVGDGGQISRIDPTTDRIERVPGAATPIAVGAGALWARAFDRVHTIVRIDPATNQVVATIELGVDPGTIAVDGSDVWVADPAGTVVRIDATSNTVRARMWIGSLTFGIVARPDVVWVSGRSFDDRHAMLWRVDPATNTVVATITTSVNCGTLAADAGVTWVECITARQIDASRNALVSTRAGALVGLAAADGAAWALDQSRRTLARISNVDDTIRAIAVPAGSEGVAVGYGAVWVANPDVAGVVTRDGQGSLTRIPTSRFGASSPCTACDQTASRPQPRSAPDAHDGRAPSSPERRRTSSLVLHFLGPCDDVGCHTSG
jgi:hypothetical protein